MRAAAIALLVATAHAGAQSRSVQRIEIARIQGVTRPEVGTGVTGALGGYLRTEIFVSYDFSGGEAGDRPFRGEAQIRFMLDPLAQQRWGLSFAGGLGRKGRAYMVAAADLEGPRLRRVRPAIQLALGGGTRLAFILRGARLNRR